MVTVADLQRLQGLQGMPLLDAASDLVGMPRPSQYSKPITTARPEVLTGTAAEWEAVAAKVRTQRESLQQHIDSVMQNWSGEAAESFRSYSAQLMRSVEAQEGAVSEVPHAITGMHDCITKAEETWYGWVSFSAQALASGFIVGAIGLIIGILIGGPPGAIAGFLIGLVVGFILAALWKLFNGYIETIIDRKRCLDERERKMRKQREKATAVKVRSVEPPPDPVITGDGFSSINLA